MPRSDRAPFAGIARITLALTVSVGLVALLASAGSARGGGTFTVPPKVKTQNPGVHGTQHAVSPAILQARSLQSTALGFCGGDDWEPDIAVDPSGAHVYVVWAHYPGDTACDPASGNQNRIYIRASNDGGQTFGPAHVVADQPAGTDYPSQVDCVVYVDRATGFVYVSFLAYNVKAIKTDVIVARSTNGGQTFTSSKVNKGCTNCDHPWTIARGNHVYTAYDQGKDHYISLSKDAGLTWTESLVASFDTVAFAEGAVMDSAGNAFFAWGDCKTSSCNGNTAGDYTVSKTLAGTLTTTFTPVASAPAGPKCPYAPSCGFAYFGIQDDIGIDAAGTLYLVWQDGQDHTKAGSPPIVQLSNSTNGGQTWTYVGRADDKAASGCAQSACYALFPRVEGGTAGHIDVMWMDDRKGSPIDHTNGWNVWVRTSTDGGQTWTDSRRVSTPDPTRPQWESSTNGFLFPYGDYEDVKLAGGQAFMIWGEGIDYTGGPSDPGAVVYRSMSA